MNLMLQFCDNEENLNKIRFLYPRFWLQCRNKTAPEAGMLVTIFSCAPIPVSPNILCYFDRPCLPTFLTYMTRPIGPDRCRNGHSAPGSPPNAERWLGLKALA